MKVIISLRGCPKNSDFPKKCFIIWSGIFKSGDPKQRAEAIVIATTNYDNPEKIIEVSKDLGEPMVGINIDDLKESEKLAKRGW